MDNWGLILDLVSLLFVIGVAAFILILILVIRDYLRLTKGTRIHELAAIWVVATAGSIIGSVMIGILGIILVSVSGQPNIEFERGAALVGAAFGSCLSIPTGIAIGGFVGTIIVYLLLRLNVWRPQVLASVGAFVSGALASALSLIPVGFFFYAVGHI